MSLLSTDTWTKIKPVFAAAFPKEAVVAVFANGTWREIDNIHPHPWEAFTISDEECVKLVLEEPTLLLHSHPNGQAWPSDEDTAGQLATGWNWGIVAVTGNFAGEIQRVEYPEIWGADAPVAPLEGRSFLWGIRDCWTLCWDYYRTHGHPEMPAIPRVKQAGGHHTEPRKVDPFTYWPPRLGFVPVERADRQPGDLCVMYHHSPIPNHTAVFMGEAKYLEQPEKGLSKVRHFDNEEKLLAKLCATFWRIPDAN